jgi:signal transduction histidine kinase
MSRIGELMDGFRGVGLTVDTLVSGRPCALPAAVDLVAYRAVQESLTNVGKHAQNAAATVRLDYRPDSLAVTVANAGTGQASRAAGHRMGSTAGFGLIGMRERVHSVGGQLRAGPTPDGGFVVTATLPLDSAR